MHFFPSRNITIYMAKLFIVRSFAVLMMLVLILMTLDLLGESGKILSVPGNDQGDVLHYVSLRAPQIIARFPTFFRAAGHPHHFCGVKPEQRSRGNEGGWIIGASDFGADVCCQPWCCGYILCL